MNIHINTGRIIIFLLDLNINLMLNLRPSIVSILKLIVTPSQVKYADNQNLLNDQEEETIQ